MAVSLVIHIMMDHRHRNHTQHTHTKKHDSNIFSDHKVVVVRMRPNELAGQTLSTYIAHTRPQLEAHIKHDTLRRARYGSALPRIEHGCWQHEKRHQCISCC